MATKKEPTANEIAMKAVRDAGERMKTKCGGIGEHCVYLPTSEIKTFIDDEGNLQAILGISQFTYLVDQVLRQS